VASNVVTEEPMLPVILCGEDFAERLSYVSSAETVSRRPKITKDCHGETVMTQWLITQNMD